MMCVERNTNACARTKRAKTAKKLRSDERVVEIDSLQI